jgi:cytochrome P450
MRNQSSMVYPPGPSKILPNALLRKFMHDPLKTLTDIARTYGDIAHFKFGRQHVYLINNPDYIEDILVKNHRHFIKSRGLQASKRLLGEGLVTSEGKYHDRQRRLIQPTFYPNRINRYGQIMTSCTLYMCNNWNDGSILDIHKEMMHVTAAIISKSVLGSDLKLAENEIGDALLTCMQYISRLQMPFGELIEKIPILPINKGFRRAKNKLDSLVYGMIKEHRENLGKGQNDLLFTMLQAQDEEQGIGRMTDLQLRDEVMTIFLAGHETTANALTWTFYLLSQNPVIESRLHKELHSIVGEDGDGEHNTSITVDDVPKLEYTNKILIESMRLYPPAWTLGRQAINDYSVGKYVIPAGSIILMSQYVMHRDQRYFPEPDRFYPDRWTQEFKRRLPRFCYFPFGGGSRSCVGEPFALIEATLLIAIICKNWKMRLAPEQKVSMKPLITLRPKYGMRMKLNKIKI